MAKKPTLEALRQQAIDAQAGLDTWRRKARLAAARAEHAERQVRQERQAVLGALVEQYLGPMTAGHLEVLLKELVAGRALGANILTSTSSFAANDHPKTEGTPA